MANTLSVLFNGGYIVKLPPQGNGIEVGLWKSGVCVGLKAENGIPILQQLCKLIMLIN